MTEMSLNMTLNNKYTYLATWFLSETSTSTVERTVWWYPCLRSYLKTDSGMFPVSTLVEISFTIYLLLIFLLFRGVDDDFADELLRISLLLFALDSCVVVLSRVLEPVDVVITEGSLEASRLTINWYCYFILQFFCAVFTAEAYDGAAEDEDDGGTCITSPLASPYLRPFSVLMRWISFSCIQIGQDLKDAQWSSLQFRCAQNRL